MAGAVSLAQAQAPASPADALKIRQAGMKATGANAGAIKKALEAGADLTPLAAKAQAIVDWAHRIPTMFPPGSDAGKTRALPAIWSSKADFDKHAADLAAAATRLEAALKANDATAAKAAFRATGATCGACHRGYRTPA